MAYLRRAVGHRRRRPYRISCVCRAALYTFERYCPSCGNTNNRFDAKAFRRLAKANVDEINRMCERGDHFIEGMHLSTEEFLPFCTICGRALGPWTSWPNDTK